jgi:large subunit ribosomal protein L23
MALLKSKKNKEKKAEKKVDNKKAEKEVNNTVNWSTDRDLSRVIVRPRITEKAAIVSEDGVYVFDVSSDATKTMIKEAIEKIYKVSPRKIRITKVPSKLIRIRGERGKRGVKTGGKKAYVYLKKGDSIEFV